MFRSALGRRCAYSTAFAPRRSLANLAAAKRAWNGRLVISEEVEHALQAQNPVIALESTIITHGMPFPHNLSTARSLESIIRDKGVTPATIALIDGLVYIGLSPSQVERLADQSPGSKELKVKVSRRDLAPALATRVIGGTTVAGTMYVAESVGIGMFVTGGIGGVHRGAESSMDVSADLIELGRTAMGVVCAGAKSILDIPRTLEVLETQGVCVATYGDKSDFPAFYTPSSGQTSPWTVGTPLAAAELVGAGLSLPTPLSTLLAVPIPAEHGAAGDQVQRAVEVAVRESVEQGIDKRGKEVTPWLLKRVGELTGGQALQLNVKLIENNARVGADVAVELARIRKETQSSSHASSSTVYSSPASSPRSSIPSPALPSSETPIASSSTRSLPSPRVVVFGSAAMDVTSHTSVPLSPRSTTPGSITLTPGGVGRNVAEAAQNLLDKHAVMLVSALAADNAEKTVGDGPSHPDAVGQMLLTEMGRAGMRTDGLTTIKGERTAACSLVLEGHRDLVNGVADMSIVEKLDPDLVGEVVEGHKPDMIVFDCNPRVQVLERILQVGSTAGIPTFCDPTSIPKLPRLITALTPLIPPSPADARPLTHIAPNLLELDLLYASLTSDLLPSDVQSRSWEYINSLNLDSGFRAKLDKFTLPAGRTWIKEQGVVPKAISCLPFVQTFWVKCGASGLVYITRTSTPPPVASAPPGSGALVHQLGKQDYLSVVHFPAGLVDPKDIVSTTGAGDTLSGGIVAGLLSHSRIREGGSKGGGGRLTVSEMSEVGTLDWIQVAMERAERSIKSQRAVG